MYDLSKLTTDSWTEHSLGIYDGGDVGGDIQISDSFERQFARRRGDEFEVLTFWTYVASEDENRHEGDVIPEDAWVQTMVGYSRCTDLEDVGGSETYSDYRYWDGPGHGMTTPEQARELCAGLTREDLSEAELQMVQ